MYSDRSNVNGATASGKVIRKGYVERLIGMIRNDCQFRDNNYKYCYQNIDGSINGSGGEYLIGFKSKDYYMLNVVNNYLFYDIIANVTKSSPSTKRDKEYVFPLNIFFYIVKFMFSCRTYLLLLVVWAFNKLIDSITFSDVQRLENYDRYYTRTLKYFWNTIVAFAAFFIVRAPVRSLYVIIGIVFDFIFSVLISFGELFIDFIKHLLATIMIINRPETDFGYVAINMLFCVLSYFFIYSYIMYMLPASIYLSILCAVSVLNFYSNKFFGIVNIKHALLAGMTMVMFYYQLPLLFIIVIAIAGILLIDSFNVKDDHGNKYVVNIPQSFCSLMIGVLIGSHAPFNLFILSVLTNPMVIMHIGTLYNMIHEHLVSGRDLILGIVVGFLEIILLPFSVNDLPNEKYYEYCPVGTDANKSQPINTENRMSLSKKTLSGSGGLNISGCEAYDLLTDDVHRL